MVNTLGNKKFLGNYTVKTFYGSKMLGKKRTSFVLFM